MIAKVSVLGAINNKEDFQRFLYRANKEVLSSHQSRVYIIPAYETRFNKSYSLVTENIGETVIPYTVINQIDNMRSKLRKNGVYFIPAFQSDLEDYKYYITNIVKGIKVYC